MKLSQSFWAGAIKFTGTTIMATASATWAARGIVADYDKRLTVVETRQQFTESTVTKRLDDIQTDVREVRAAVLGEKTTRGQ